MAEVIERISDLKTVTPMMQQYLDVKRDYQDYVLFYRLGDFYEMFFEDAVKVSSDIGLTLTGRDCGDGKRAAMCGVPFHKSEQYIGELVSRGYKVAVCEQVEDPALAEGLVKREVIRVVTPGTITNDELLSGGKNNYLCAVAIGAWGYGLGFADVSTGQISATYITGDNRDARLYNEFSLYSPSETIISMTAADCPELVSFLSEKAGSMVNDSFTGLFDYPAALSLMKETMRGEADKIGEPDIIRAVGALLGYIKETQKTSVTFAKELNVYSDGQYLEIDQNTRRNLELTENMRTKEKRGSLLWVLDKTRTAMGARLMRSRILKPLINPVIIMKRQNCVADFYGNFMAREDLDDVLSGMLDIERLTAKTVYGSANAKDLRAICQSISLLPRIKEIIAPLKSSGISEIYASLDTLEDIAALIDSAIVEDPPFSVRDGGMIKDGYNGDIDYYREIHSGGSKIKDSIEENERERTGIKNLRVGYNKVFGYYIEVTKSFADQVPQDYIRKQTLTNCERYITPELKDMETTVLGAADKLCALEYEIFTEIRQTVADNAERLKAAATLVAELDVYSSLAKVASKNSYICPEIDTGGEIIIKDGRHPVVEQFVKDSYFVPNDTVLDTADNRMMLITGPNMAGKSTYMRQVAIIVIMAQTGSFVPAKSARIGIVDKVFTRVGASDDLASGQSTFMLEMNEVAGILKNATRRSLIIYDEVGRGTSTYDGMAIARAVIEYTSGKKIGAKTMFATHYHELTSMEGEYDGIVNYNIAAKKRNDSLIFLRKIVRGAADDSYGIEVAKLAGIPGEVVSRAKEILKSIESGSAYQTTGGVKSGNIDVSDDIPDFLQELENGKEREAAEKIRSADINTMTPIEAMNLVFTLKKLLES